MMHSQQQRPPAYLQRGFAVVGGMQGMQGTRGMPGFSRGVTACRGKNGSGCIDGASSAATVHHSNVYVGNLPEGITEEKLRGVFEPYGQVKSCVVLTRGKQTYGFVEYNTVMDAEAAIARMNGQSNLIVKFAKNDAGLDMSEPFVPHSNIYVANLPSSMTEDFLKEALEPYGEVISIRLKTAESGKAYGFVKFGTISAAVRALTALGCHPEWTVKLANNDASPGKASSKEGASKGSMPKGGAWLSGWTPGAKGGQRESDKFEGEPSDNLYIKDLPAGISDEEVTAIFSSGGHVVERRILRWDDYSPCAALVRMSSVEQAIKAKGLLDNTVPESSQPRLNVTLQDKHGKSIDDHCYVTGVPLMTSESQIKKIFAPFGEVKWTRLIFPSLEALYAGCLTCVALVQMGGPEECQAAIAGLDDQRSPDLGTPISVRFADSSKKPMKTEVKPNNNLYVKGWPAGFPEFLLQSAFKQYGTVVRLRLFDNPNRDQPTCAALIQMSRVEEATAALQQLHGRTITPPLPPMHVRFAGRDQAAGDNLYVTALPRTITEAQIQDTFKKYGQIKRLRLLQQHGTSEAHALVQLASPEKAELAIRELDGTVPAFKGATLCVAYAMERVESKGR